MDITHLKQLRWHGHIPIKVFLCPTLSYQHGSDMAQKDLNPIINPLPLMIDKTYGVVKLEPITVIYLVQN